MLSGAASTCPCVDRPVISLGSVPSAIRPLQPRRHANWEGRVSAAGPLSPPADPAAIKPDPFAEVTQYNDNALDRFFISVYSRKMAAQLPGVVPPVDAVYDDFVRLSKEIMKGRTSEEQRLVVREVLFSLLPPHTPAVFKRLFPPTKFSAEFNAWIAAASFFWLVGDAELKREPVEVAPGVMRLQSSTVHIKKCRYLEMSGCVGLCFNMCKVPTQRFFTDDMGLPLTMNPNFDDLSCDMIFGQTPPPVELDPAFAQPCFVNQCSMASSRPQPVCPKVEIIEKRPATPA